MPKYLTIDKKIGETPLGALERVRNDMVKGDQVNAEIWQNIPMTYAGRLDPMASGQLIILIGEECKNKEKYLTLNKVYEVTIVFGVTTDTYDALGIPSLICDDFHNFDLPDFSKYAKTFKQQYPPYSSKTVDGEHLHSLSRKNISPIEIPEKEVSIYSIKTIEPLSTIDSEELLKRIIASIDLVNGDFRQDEIKQCWREILESKENLNFPRIKIRVHCTSGTYMRSLAFRIGNDIGIGAFALGINRISIG